MSKKKKPAARVLSIQGGRLADVVITQEKLRLVASLQEAEWLANRAAQRAVMELEAALFHGAQIEPGPLSFDPDLRMVRSKKTG